MHQFPKGIKFIYEWRSYQQKALAELYRHLQNRHFHLVAPPGSGKTVLGLEVVLRLNKPTLILAPTLTIKNQWCERFVELFLQHDHAPEWISLDIKNPRFLTITTYQALHSLYTRDEAASDHDHSVTDETAAATDMKQTLNEIGFQTLVLDEAHHLRTEWWKSVRDFRYSLLEPNIVALTATPPYDVSPAEWDRYIELCGPIDVEIRVPELVKERDLCPHQDYIYYTQPTAEERETLQLFHRHVRTFQHTLEQDASFIDLLENHPWLAQPDDNLEDILDNPAYFSSMIIFLKHAGRTKWQDVIHILGTKSDDVPVLTLEWLEELLTGCLFHDVYTIDAENVKAHKKELKRIGAIERRKVYLRSTKKLDRLLVQSVSKLNSIQDIVRFERNVLKDDLRLVILTDYIRLSDLPKNEQDEQLLTRLGVIPIFEKLRREHDGQIKLGVLCGSIAIVPATVEPLLQSSSLGDHMHLTPLKHDQAYVTLQMKNHHQQDLVRIVTQIFSTGGIHVLVGTTALLGEGWDAPSINTLILASYVGTFMLSNQMRGRAIRTERGNEGKTSNIWHLVCLDSTQMEQGYDMHTLTRRFRSFVGVSIDGRTIENGIGRMNPEPPPFNPEKIKQMNERMLDLAGEREELSRRWDQAIARSEGHMVEELQTMSEALPRPFIFRNTIRTLISQALIAGGFFLSSYFNGLEQYQHRDMPFKSFLSIIMLGFVGAFVVMLPKTVKALKLIIRNGTVEKSMKQVGMTVLLTLHHMQLIKTDLKHITVQSDCNDDGSVYCWMQSGSRMAFFLSWRRTDREERSFPAPLSSPSIA